MMVPGLSTWRSPCPSRPSTESPRPKHSARVTAGSSAGAQAHPAAAPHRTRLLPHSGIMLAGPARVARYRPATALPAGGSDGPARQAATGRP